MSTTENEVPATAPEIDPATAEDVYSLPVLEEVPLFNDDVQKRILRRGTGECPVPGALISCHFVGRIRSTKKVFDSSRQRNEPFTFILGEKQVIRAWDNAIGTMRVGEFAILDCKADYCYGAMGLPPDVPEDADLLFEIELLGWEPNTKTISPGVAKQYLRRGEGWSSPGFGSVCTVKILGRIGGETGEVFLDCVEDPILVPIDVPQLPIGLEIALCSMKKKEKAAFWIEGEMAGDGFEPLRHLVPVPRDAQLYYELELEDLETVKETWEMPIAAKVEEARRLKDAGNDFFRAQQPSRALARYDAVLKMFEFDDDEQIAPEDLPGVHAVKLPALCNSAIVRAKQGKHKEVVKLCEEALEIDPDHVKTLYRLAHAQAALGMLDEAVAALEHAREAPGADPARVTEVDRLLGPLRARLAKLNKKEKNMWSSAFSEFSATDDAAPAAKEPEAAVSEPEAAKAAEPVEATKSADAAKPTEEADISAAP